MFLRRKREKKNRRRRMRLSEFHCKFGGEKRRKSKTIKRRKESEKGNE